MEEKYIIAEAKKILIENGYIVKNGLVIWKKMLMNVLKWKSMAKTKTVAVVTVTCV